MSLVARWFAGCGYQVSVLTWDEGGPAEEMIDGVRVLKICRQGAGIKGLRFFWPKWTSLIAAMKRADADVYYHNLAECTTGQTALWCRQHGRRFVFSVSANTQCKTKLPYRFQERILYRYGLKLADYVIVQTRKQQKMLQDNYGCDSVVLPMPCPGPNETDFKDCKSQCSDSQHVLWLGRICEIKRPDRLLDLAEACPDLHFDLVGPEDGTDYSHNVYTRARTITNLTLHGPASRDRVPEFYKKAKILCCTSESEGFPNTFLEAWSYALPTVSTFDPDNLIVDNGLGVVAQDIVGLAAGISSLCESPDLRREMSQRARKFYLKNYTVDAVMAKYEKVFREVYEKSICRKHQEQNDVGHVSNDGSYDSVRSNIRSTQKFLRRVNTKREDHDRT
ncbi:MAG: glycosyltransferase family 4 protein [Deltaproteobacteria bacterium]|nr:glycosyltransferase family 4 protein [Deltaproteobacteria bacterium]